VPSGASLILQGGGVEAEADVGVRVLIVEDSPTHRSVLRHRLVEICCEVVGEAGNASEGLELFRTLHPQLVTLDPLMPQAGGSGRQITVSVD